MSRGWVPAVLPRVFYPFSIAIYPIAALLAANIQTIDISETYRASAASLLFAAAMLLGLRVALKDWHRAALITSVTLLLFYSYGHLYNVIRAAEIFGFNVGRHRYLSAAWLTLLALSLFFFGFRIRGPSILSPVLNVFGAVLLSAPLYTILTSEISSAGAQPSSLVPVMDGTPAEPRFSGARPDIYYIILDGYAREDVLLNRYGYDNSQFIRFLESRGFQVAAESQANYLYTALSLGSSLNMQYVQDFDVDFDTITYPRFLFEPIHRSSVRQKLAGYGYVMVTVPTGYEATDTEDAEYRLTPDMDSMEVLLQGEVLNRFEGLIVSTSALRTIVDWQSAEEANWFARQLAYPYHVHRLNVLSAFKNLKTIPYIPGPKFVFVHIIAPHRPYIFGPHGEEINPEGVFTFHDIDDIPGEGTANAYLAQLTFVTSQAEDAIDAILERSQDPPIIILQSDHGPGFGLDWETPEADTLRDRAAILNAYYMPAECERDLYPSITPVNSFRILFRCVFGESYDLLPDVAYFNNIRYSSLSEPWIFTPIDEFE